MDLEGWSQRPESHWVPVHFGRAGRERREGSPDRERREGSPGLERGGAGREAGGEK